MLQCSHFLVFTPQCNPLPLCVLWIQWLASEKDSMAGLWNVTYKINFKKTVASVLHSLSLSFSCLLRLLALLKQGTWWRNSYGKANIFSYSFFCTLFTDFNRAKAFDFHDVNLSVFPFIEHAFCVKSKSPSSKHRSWRYSPSFFLKMYNFVLYI